MTGSALSAIFLSGFAPRRVARAHQDTSLPAAYLIHWAGLLLGVPTILLVLARDPRMGTAITSLWQSAGLFAASTIADCVTVIAVAEAAFVLLALALLPWGAASAPVRALWHHALRTIWLHTGHCCFGTWLCIAFLMYCKHYAVRHWQIYQDTRPTIASLAHWAAYNYEYLMPLVIAGCTVWYLWALLRAMTTPLGEAETPHPPLCEACGYNLSHHEISARCPECGRPVEASLGPDVRSPAGWGRFRKRYRPTTFVQATVDAWFRPRLFFMGLSTTRGLAAAGAFLLRHLLLSALGLLGGFGAALWVLMPREIDDFFGELGYGVACAGAVVALILGLFASLLAGIAGLVVSKSERRNCTGGCLRIACFCSGILPVWTTTFMILVVIIGKLLESMSPIPRWLWVLWPTVTIGVHVGFLVVYTGAVLRRIRYVRYANS